MEEYNKKVMEMRGEAGVEPTKTASNVIDVIEDDEEDDTPIHLQLLKSHSEEKKEEPETTKDSDEPKTEQPTEEVKETVETKTEQPAEEIKETVETKTEETTTVVEENNDEEKKTS